MSNSTSIRKLGIGLWILVLIVGAIWVFSNMQRPDPSAPAAETIPGHDGRAFVDIAWKRLPSIPPFELTEKSGETFDSRSLAGKPYVLSFFFTDCPTICQDLNRQIARLANRFKDSEMTFIGLSVDCKNDTPEVLREYFANFGGDPGKWLMMTEQKGQKNTIQQIGNQQLNVVVDGVNHTGDIFLIDRWGRFRDRFTWDDPREMKRFAEVAREVMAETAPPLEAMVHSRNVMASLSHEQRNASSSAVPWLFDFQLIDQNGQPFYSRDLTGQVWVASFFFTRCGTVCPQQNAFLAKLQPDIVGRDAQLVSITTDPEFDQPAVLRQYARDLTAGEDWIFLTGDEQYIQRVGSEFLGIPVHGEHHSTLLVVVDRWGNVRGRLNWQVEGQREALLQLVDQLNKETVPPADPIVMTAGAHAESN
ncbi:MAG: SCO family protein [Pirellulaceae bacterium]